MAEAKVNLIELNRYRNVNNKDIDTAKLFVTGKLKDTDKVPSWVQRFKDDLTVKKGNLVLGDRVVVSNQERDTLMRKLVYDIDSDVAPSRDAGYYLIKKRYANISRRQWLAFLKSQRIIRKTDNAPQKAKRGGKKLTRTGELECDLFFISRDDLPKYMRKGVTQLYAVLVCVDRLTSLCYTELTFTKERQDVTPALDRAVKFFTKRLAVPASKQTWYMDAGKEFDPKFFSNRNIDRHVVTAGNKVEKKNSDIQRQFHRLRRAERFKSIEDGLKQSTTVVNSSYNRVIKMSANEAADKYSNKDEVKLLMNEYNKHREKADSDRRRPLKIGDMVRLVMKSTKGSSTFYKAYRGAQYTQDGYPVHEGNIAWYKDRKVTKEFYEVKEIRGKNPTKYKVDGKWHTRDRLSEPIPKMKDDQGNVIKVDGKHQYTDMKSEALMKQRNKDRRKPKPKKKKKSPSKDVKNKQAAKVKKEMQPSPDATVHAFKEDIDAVDLIEKVSKELIAQGKKPYYPTEAVYNTWEKSLEKLMGYFQYKRKVSKGFLKDNYRDFITKVKGLQNRLKKLK